MSLAFGFVVFQIACRVTFFFSLYSLSLSPFYHPDSCNANNYFIVKYIPDRFYCVQKFVQLSSSPCWRHLSCANSRAEVVQKFPWAAKMCKGDKPPKIVKLEIYLRKVEFLSDEWPRYQYLACVTPVHLKGKYLQPSGYSLCLLFLGTL